MKKYTKRELEEAAEQIAVCMDYCKKQQESLIAGTSKHSKLGDRIEALRISQSLMAGGVGSEYTLQELRKAIALVAGTINNVKNAGQIAGCEGTKEIAQNFIAEELCSRLSRQSAEEIERCEEALKEVQKKYDTDHDLQAYETGLHIIAKRHRSHYGLSMSFANTGEDLFRSGKQDEGMAFIKAAMEDFDDISDDITLYLLSAQYYIEQGEVERGKSYLIKLCTETASNYEEAIGFRDLNDVWEKYRYLIEGQVPASFTSHQPLPFDQCTMQIKEILALDRNDMFIALSEHLDERSGYGDNLSYLNQWERNIYDVMTLSDEVGSGGFSLYLTHYSCRFSPVRKALKFMGAGSMIDLLDRIREKFPEQKIPGSINRAEDMLDEMEEKGIDFEKEDTQYYEKEEGILMEKLLQYIIANQKRLR